MSLRIKCAIHTLERLTVRSGIAQSVDLFGAMPTAEIRHEIEQIKQSMVEDVFSLHDTANLGRYLRYNQLVLIRFVDRVSREEVSPSLKPLQQAATEILTFIEQHFPDHMDLDITPPHTELRLAHKRITKQLDKLSRVLATKEAEPDLANLVIEGIKQLTTPTTKATYRTLAFAREVQAEIHNLCESTDTHTINDALRQLLCYLNFNTRSAWAYQSNYLNRCIKEVMPGEKLERIAYWIKSVSQAPVKAGSHFDPRAPSLKDQLIVFLKEELEYHAKMQQQPATVPALNNPSDKLKLQTSVAQMACLLRIMVDCRLLQQVNLTQAMRWIAKAIASKQTKDLSYDSLRAKYYNIEQGTWRAVRNSLTQMLNYIDNQ